MNNKRLLATTAGLGIVLSFGYVSSASADTDSSNNSQKTVVSHDLRITNGNTNDFAMPICKDWKQLRGHDFSKSCKNSSYGTLYDGQNSKTKYGWSDTDAVRIPKGYSLKWDKKGPNVVIWSCSEVNSHGSGYYKVSPSVSKNGQTRKFYYKKCN